MGNDIREPFIRIPFRNLQLHTKPTADVKDGRQNTINYLEHIYSNQIIHLVTSVEECRWSMRDIKAHCDEYNVLGLDCEWTSSRLGRNRVSLLQLATHRGLCVLIQLARLEMIPEELKVILKNTNIIKVGVEVKADANYLKEDYGICVASILDLRYMAVLSGFYPCGLKKMSDDYLSVKISKKAQCSNWASNELSNKQIDYAAKDAHVSILLFRHFCSFQSENIDSTKFLNVHYRHKKRHEDI